MDRLDLSGRSLFDSFRLALFVFENKFLFCVFACNASVASSAVQIALLHLGLPMLCSVN